MIKVENLSYSFPQKDLFNKISFTLEKKEHCAFIGTSGSGKSTMIDMILNPNDYLYDGLLEIDPTCRMGYISQFIEEHQINKTVFDFIAERFLDLQGKIDKICNEMATAEDVEPLLEDYQNAFDAYEALGGDGYENAIEKKLGQAGLMKLRDQKVSELSGGEFKLLQVIKEMLLHPDLIIMDEPDVFLDFENLNGLKNLMNSHKGVLLVITHNRYLLNHCFNKIIHLENMELNEFEGRYIEYNLSLMQTKIELQEMAIKDTEEIARNEALIDQLREAATAHAEASKGRSLKARVKIQERLEAKRTQMPFVDIKQPGIYFEHDKDLEDKIILTATDYSAAFDEILLENTNFEIGAKDKVALIGPNGTGKTTLLRDIFNKNKHIKIDEDTKVAFLSQHQNESLKESNRIVDEFFDAGFATYSDIKSHLFSYGFEEKNLTQTISSLSGGEKNILQLAKIAASKADFLLLDEPTSHLDTYSQIALERAIDNYPGAVLMISHDYYTIVNSMDYVLLIEDQTIRKVKMKKFKRMIYKKHFDKDYLEIEQKKKAIETRIETALKKHDFESAKMISLELEEIIKAF
ncbi:ABC-F family ATP-binding cassette domain-containing protein [Acidaminobacter sp. JC074]|uniref:ABC-F family ATP-binding cassette domain-containing protein n=1 Tax=Acidaminobacter sp. JC074 TaxID=2530199 RepID=UPI001F0D851B|nr:ATP-binding cassette domain-containing protein [Acidaminobacter sp. JC074]MCH4886825.1 ABC-F family ATP-binding cassette domain-containing protein [Acidaminobacter sp. JC074]